ncbi:Twitching mobility protein [Planctomycetes bacterium Poly30]|uniref:Twitching mobility protein n=1 Tax=Saltatorellus ferox TaxID=2528018 RepID=A0A518EMN8_9BACT|nr:Twitching mobility protein [Planctomycetes bacterium Poly30]
MAWIDALFTRMVELGASDLHMSSKTKPQFRLHGDMVPIQECAVIEPDQMAQILREIAPADAWKDFEKNNDLDFAYYLPGVARFRVNFFQDNRGPGAVFRQIPEEILTCDQLNLPPAVRELCFLSKGLVVVTGPTGSGKSTTLAAMIDHINKNRADHILTIEDPIEFVHKDQKCLINQREVGAHTASFKRALKAALREDPDIVLVGEMRDLETIEIAIETAETGHLVFGTLHTTTAASTVDRIIDQFPADRQSQIRTMLSSSLKGVVAQTLCKKQAGGRVAALEVLLVNSAVSSLIREGKTHQITSSMQMGGKVGMRLLNDSLAELVRTGTVSPSEAYIKAVDKDGFVSAINAAGVRWDASMLSNGGASAPGTAPHPAPAQQQQQQQPQQQQQQRPQPQPQAPAAPLPSQAHDQEMPPSPVADPFEQFKKGRT